MVEDYSHCRKITDFMHENIGLLFESFIMISKYEEALDIICNCTNVLPTPLVVNKVIFEVIKNCNGEQAHKAAFYLEDALSMTPEDLNFDFKKTLEDSTGTFHDIWSVFAHFVKSSLYDHQIGDMKNYSSHMEPIKSPNCDVLVGYYVKVFVSTPIKSLLIQNNFEERFRTLSYWINNFYKYNIENSDLLEHLHILLDCLVDCYIIQNSSLPIHVLINKEKLADIAFIIVSICKNAFSNSYNLQRFLSYSQLPYLKIIVCQFRLHELIKGKSLPIVPVPLSLYTIVKDYFMIPQGKKMEIERKHLILKLYIKLNNGIKNKVPGDTDLHRFCRKGKSADLKEILSRGKCPYINVKNSAGRTPLHEACISSNFSCCKILLEETKTNEVNLKATDNEGYTPLHFAVLMNSKEIVQYLLTLGGLDLLNWSNNLHIKLTKYITSNHMKELLENFGFQFKIEAQEFPECLSPFNGIFPGLKINENYPLYIFTLHTLLINYCNTFKLFHLRNVCKSYKDHDERKCCHYSASAVDSMCLDDYLGIKIFSVSINLLIKCLKDLEKEINIKDELSMIQSFSNL